MQNIHVIKSLTWKAGLTQAVFSSEDAGSKHTPALTATGHFKNQGTMDSALNKPPK